MSDFVRGLKCRLCGKTFPQQAINCCDEDYGPLEVDYDYDAIREAISRAGLALKMESIRGGTDGSRLSFIGLPCPNLFAGEQAIHSKLEFISVQDMNKAKKAQ